MTKNKISAALICLSIRYKAHVGRMLPSQAIWPMQIESRRSFVKCAIAAGCHTSGMLKCAHATSGVNLNTNVNALVLPPAIIQTYVLSIYSINRLNIHENNKLTKYLIAVGLIREIRVFIDITLTLFNSEFKAKNIVGSNDSGSEPPSLSAPPPWSPTPATAPQRPAPPVDTCQRPCQRLPTSANSYKAQPKSVFSSTEACQPLASTELCHSATFMDHIQCL